MNGKIKYKKNNLILVLLFFIIPCILGISDLLAETDPLSVQVSKAYIQSITNGPGVKAVPEIIDYVAEECNSSTVWENNCQQAILDEKDGKTHFMDSIIPIEVDQTWQDSNISILLPEEDLARVYIDILSDTKVLFEYMSTPENGWYSDYEGEQNAKGILLAYMNYIQTEYEEEILANENVGHATWIGGTYSSQAAEELQAIEVGFSLEINEIDESTIGLYYWAITVGMTDMQYPPGFDFSLLPGNGLTEEKCANTTSSWGHIGLQWISGSRKANWGGGGDGSGVDDYGCGGADTRPFDWEKNIEYQIIIRRGDQVDTNLWKWQGFIEENGIIDWSSEIYGGEYLDLSYFNVMTETGYGIVCNSGKEKIYWSNPYVKDIDGVEHEINEATAQLLGEKANPLETCQKANQKLISSSPIKFSHSLGEGVTRNFDTWDDLLVDCNSGDTMQCSTGLQGICSTGTQTCIAENWNNCVQNQEATVEICGNGIDEDCNGVDLSCPAKNLTYTANLGGAILGDTNQTVTHGSDGSAVTAVPNTNYHFVDWSDSSTQNPRTDTSITADITVTANFEEDATSPIYRFWSDTKQGHFYTSSEDEKNYIIATYAEDVWRYEGVAYNSYSTSGSGITPVYRFWSNQKQHHFYTASESEKDYIIATYDSDVWNYERIAYYAYSSSQSGTIPVFRFWSDIKQGHFYTSSESERDYIVATYPTNVWVYEGIAWYVPEG